MLAAAVLRQIASVLGSPGFLEITIEGSETLDFNSFDHRQHAGALLDGVGDAYLLHKNREILQGRTKACKGGQSATMVYSYPYTLARRAVVATFDLSASHLSAFYKDHWLANRQNVIVLWLEEEAFIKPVQTPRGSGVPTLPPIAGPQGSPSRPPTAKRCRQTANEGI